MSKGKRERQEIQPKSNRLFSTDLTPGTPRNKAVRVNVRDPRKLSNKFYRGDNFIKFSSPIIDLRSDGEDLIVKTEDGQLHVVTSEYWD